ncbi:aldose epimerase family protein [Gracilimonas mengyeensis]|uniref:Aldose 1-epimerase n=1 Tax=Gracilimonas mengyeensis TaxID=1302730 RepID=A0A521AY42_9BACT|nr:aldose epimerase family protein [Gracilimonas mengyeensis]SMO39782.1 aldose 1-epimerase [Gracilimonas mengyeensis]
MAQTIMNGFKLLPLLAGSMIFLFATATVISGCQKAEEKKPVTNQESFGTLEDGREAHLYTLKNSKGMEVKVTNYGGTVTSIVVPDAEGNMDNVILGYDDVAGYEADNPFFGATIGRYGNRIAEGKFELNGEEYQLNINDGENHLHGGEKGFFKVLWNTEEVTDNSLTISYLSEDGEQGYPGNLEVSVTFTVTEDNGLNIDYTATTDKATPVNLTNHSYFNLSGDPETRILDHMLTIDADHYTPVNEQLIPTGEIAPVEGTAFDFTEPHEIGARIDQIEGGYDHNYVLDRSGEGMENIATLYDPETGRQMDVITTEPGIQFYSGNFLDGSLQAPDGTPFIQYSALCLETQHYPDSPNQPDFPSTILEPGETYQTQTTYRFSVR